MSKIPMFEWGKFARYKNDDGTTGCYRDGKYLGSFENESMFQNLFYMMSTDITSLEERLERANEIIKNELVDFYRLEEKCERLEKQLDNKDAEIDLLKDGLDRAIKAAEFFMSHADCRKDGWACSCSFCRDIDSSTNLRLAR